MHASAHVSMLLVLWETSPSFSSDVHANTLSNFTVSCGLAGDIGRATIVYDFQFKWPGHARLRTPQQDEKNRMSSSKKLDSITREPKS